MPFQRLQNSMRQARQTPRQSSLTGNDPIYGRPVERDPIYGRPTEPGANLPTQPLSPGYNPSYGPPQGPGAFQSSPGAAPNNPMNPWSTEMDTSGDPGALANAKLPQEILPSSPSQTPSSSPYGPLPSGYDMPRGEVPSTTGFQNPYGTSMDSLRTGYRSGNEAVDKLVAAMPGYQGIMETDPKTGKPIVSDLYKADPSKSSSYRKFRNIGMSSGPSELYSQQENLINQGRSRDIDALQQESQTSYGQGLGNLAMSGGLEGGSRERLADSNALATMKGAQGVYGGAADARAKAGASDAEMKMRILQSSGATENQADMWNAGQAIGDRGKFNQFNQNMYGSLGDIIGSNETANVMGGAPTGDNRTYMEKMTDKTTKFFEDPMNANPYSAMGNYASEKIGLDKKKGPGLTVGGRKLY